MRALVPAAGQHRDRRDEDIANAQLALHRALTHFVGRRARSRRLHPLLNSEPVRRAADLVAGEGAGAEIPPRVSVRRYARVLADVHRAWAGVSLPGGSTSAVPTGRMYDDWLAAGGYEARFAPVHRLSADVEAHRSLLLRAVVHGSIATLDVCTGFSDLDAAFVVRAEVGDDADALVELRKFARTAYGRTLEYDPYMHHEPVYVSERLLSWYPEALFPPVLFAHALELMEPTPLAVARQPNDYLTRMQLAEFRAFFERLAHTEPPPSWYEVEWRLANVMLLPALYLQARDRTFRYKRETFAAARPDFPAALWEPVDRASRIRRTAPNRPTPPRWVSAAASALAMPELIHKWATSAPASRRHARIHATALDPHFGNQVIGLIEAMEERLGW